MIKIDDSKIAYSFSNQHKPILKINNGDVVRFETKDCLSNQITQWSPSLSTTSFDSRYVNPITGPIFINGLKRGDVLQVDVLKIELKDQAVITCQENLGVFGDRFDDTTFKITPIIDSKIIFDSKVSFPIKPMIGVIGVAPSDGEILTQFPGVHGGNMDNTMVREQCSVFLPVFHDGGSFGVGDVHAAMGDGEINCSAIEAAAYVTLKFTIRKDLELSNPIVLDKHHFSTIVSDASLDEAVTKSVQEMGKILESKIDLPFDEITMLMSAVGDTQICQIVNPLKTARFLMPFSVLNLYDFIF